MSGLLSRPWARALLPIVVVALVAGLAVTIFVLKRHPGKGHRGDDNRPVNLAKDIKKILAKDKWSTYADELSGEPPTAPDEVAKYDQLKMDRDLLTKSLDLGERYLDNNQKPEGNFNYLYDWLTKKMSDSDEQVRQSGALWGLALLHQYRPSAARRAALDKGLKYFFKSTHEGANGALVIAYGSDKQLRMGTIALVCLSIIDYVSSDQTLSPEYRQELLAKLDGYLKFVKSMQMRNGRFPIGYDLASGKPAEHSSPYFDGETLLCMCKAARQLNRTDLIPFIEKAAKGMAEYYTIRAWRKDKDSKETKGFYQWGSMSYIEYYQAKWKNYETFGDVTLALSWWMIHTHHSLKMKRNHAYALEGLISAYRIAKLRNDTAAMVDLLYAIDRTLYKLTAWQIGGPLVKNNPFLMSHPTDDPLAVGGVMNAAEPGIAHEGDTQHELRIDVTQHQMHAIMMALTNVY
jgi:UDP-N-acetylmuramoyl-tripeptide--D-alanyl-D-alanine ligase